jgi:predicted HTH transcriptional regulator
LNREWVGIDNNESKIANAIARIRKNNVNAKIVENFGQKPIIWDNYLSFNVSAAEIAKEKISNGENERVEFKESYHYSHFHNKKDNELPEKIMKEIAAFLNSKYGGSIFIGVKDDGTLLGLEKDFEVSGGKKDQDAFELTLASKIKDSFGGVSIDLIDWSFYEIDSKILCEIKVYPHVKPIFLNKEFYSRNGTQSLTMKNQDFFELMKRRKKI